MNLFLIADKLGCEVELLDLSWLSYRQSLLKLTEKQYDLVGISCSFTNTAPYCMKYAREIKKKYPNTKVISGGIHATFVPQDLLGNQYDYVIYGEGEITFEKFIQREKENKPVDDLRGLFFIKDGKLVGNPARKVIKELDTLPINDYTHFDLEPYYNKAGVRYIQLMTSRGCVYNCRFCSTVKMWGHKYRQQSAKRILKEFLNAKAMGIEYISVEDDDFGLDEKNVKELCELLIEKGIEIPWSMTIGSRSIKDESTLDLLAKSGCVVAGISIESASARILKEYRRAYTVNDNLKMCSRLQKRGILVENKGLIGFPDESLWEILQTYWLVNKASDVWHMSILEPRPGCDYWDAWDKKGDVSQYNKFGKGNVFFSKNRIGTYFLFRFFAFFYLLSPRRLFLSFFAGSKVERYWHKKYYIMGYWTLRANILDFLTNLFK